MNLSVVVISYRSALLLPGCARAALTFAGENVEFVLVDNAPGDGATRATKEASERTIVIENAKNVGYAAAVNQGIAAATGDVVLLLNPDIVAIDGDVALIEQEFARDKRIAALTPQLVTPDGVLDNGCRREPTPFDLVSEWLDLTGRFPNWERPRRFRMLDAPKGVRRTVDAATGACLFLRREAVEDVGRFDESFFMCREETGWLIRAKQRGWSTLCVPEVHAVHLARQSSDVPDELLSLLLLESQHPYARKHFGRPIEVGLRSALLGIDALRWVVGRGGSTERNRVGRRIRVHLTGRAPRPAGAS